MSLIGSLDEIKIADVLRLFAAGKKSGLLTVAGQGEQALLRFQKGAIVHASAARLQGDDAVIDLFGWTEGQLTFVPEERVVTPNVKRGVDALILEGVRVGAVFHKTRELVPTDRVVFQTAGGPADENARCSVGPGEWRLIRLADGTRDVRELVEATKLPRAELVRLLYEMTQAGLLERVDVYKALRVRPQGLFGKDSAELDGRFEEEWTKLVRFSRGVLRVEVRASAGKTAILGVAFRSGLLRDVHLPRGTIDELGVREGEEVSVRPVA